MSEWVKWTRPGYFGRRRDEKVAALDAQWGKGNWKLAHVASGVVHSCWTGHLERTTSNLEEVIADFARACVLFYERSYYLHFKDRKEDIDFACSFGECYDNAKTNVQCGLDYTKQESFSTHIQDIAMRNVLARLGRKFEGPPDRLLEIRSKGDGLRFSPGQVPFFDPSLIGSPSLRPWWAGEGSVEDFWQSNKWLFVKKEVIP